MHCYPAGVAPPVHALEPPRGCCFETRVALILHINYSIFTEDIRLSICDIALAIAWVAFPEEMNVSHLNLDSVIRLVASNLEEETIKEAKVRAEMEIDDKCWNRNNRLNMIAYEDQR